MLLFRLHGIVGPDVEKLFSGRYASSGRPMGKVAAHLNVRQATNMWTFEALPKKSVRRDPFEAEFFTGEEENESVYGRTDALVRETIQNSLDARLSSSEQPVRLRFRLPREDQFVTESDSRWLLQNLLPHLDALKNDFVNSTAIPRMNYLVIEDFGTRGLEGDPGRTMNPAAGDTTREDFYWFWRNIGRSGKSGTDRGRWGVGKTVFPATSKINAVFGLTVRDSDRKRLLMGQMIAKIHTIGKLEYQPEGFFCDPKQSDDIQMPFEDAEILRKFEVMFGLERDVQPGLSLVVPFRFDRLNDGEIIRSVVLHFFDPILRGQLSVRVDGPENVVEINASTIEQVAGTLKWDGRRKEKKHAAPPFALAQWAIQQQINRTLTGLADPNGPSVPAWSESMFPGNTLNELRDRFQNSDRIAVRVPLTIERKNRTTEVTHFDAFLERDSDLGSADDHFVREGMTISGISTLSGHRGIRGLVLVQDKALSGLLGDAEGPAHTEWGTGETRPEYTYLKWKRRVTFVRNSLANLISILTPPPSEMSEDWLVGIFSIEEKSAEGAKKRKKRKPTVTMPPVPDPGERTPVPYKVTQHADGFRVSGACDMDSMPAHVTIRLGYDFEGNPFTTGYDPIDFVVSDGKPESLTVVAKNVKFRSRERNVIDFEPLDPAFELVVTGFDPTRDLVVDVKAERRDTEETSSDDTQNV